MTGLLRCHNFRPARVGGEIQNSCYTLSWPCRMTNLIDFWRVPVTVRISAHFAATMNIAKMLAGAKMRLQENSELPQRALMDIIPFTAFPVEIAVALISSMNGYLEHGCKKNRLRGQNRCPLTIAMWFDQTSFSAQLRTVRSLATGKAAVAPTT